MSDFEARSIVKEMFYHAFDSYLTNAFPLDDLDSVKCIGVGWSPSSLKEYHVQGGFMLTLVDSLSTLAIFGDSDLLLKLVNLFAERFDGFSDNSVLTFEVNIRLLGGLLSAHELLTHSKSKMRNERYGNQLLSIAKDLGDRLLPAFTQSPTGVPFSLINLKTGVIGHSNSTCTAAGGTYLLEFGKLSELTGDRKYVNIADKAMKYLLSKRSKKRLIGSELDVVKGTWLDTHSAVGAGIDSFYEYLCKYAIYNGASDYYKYWRESFEAIRLNVIDEHGFLHVVNRNDGLKYKYSRIDSLAAFLPGLLTLDGEVELAEKVWFVFLTLFSKYGKIPESYDTFRKTAHDSQYFLRPEFVESTWYLHGATRKEIYKKVAVDIIYELENCCKTDCGYSSLQHTFDKESKSGVMDSFFLAETLKYLYLIFDEDHWIHSEHIVFTTEAHPFFVNSQRTFHRDFKSCSAQTNNVFEGNEELEHSRNFVKWKLHQPLVYEDYFLSTKKCFPIKQPDIKIPVEFDTILEDGTKWHLFSPNMELRIAVLSFKHSENPELSYLYLSKVDKQPINESVVIMVGTDSSGPIYEILNSRGELIQYTKLENSQFFETIPIVPCGSFLTSQKHFVNCDYRPRKVDFDFMGHLRVNTNETAYIQKVNKLSRKNIFDLSTKAKVQGIFVENLYFVHCPLEMISKNVD